MRARWKVRDVAAHLLDVELRKTAAYRDDHDVASGATIASDRDLSRVVNGLNAGGVAFAARLSPRVIVDLLEVAGGWATDVIEALPPFEPALYARQLGGRVGITELDGHRPRLYGTMAPSGPDT